MPAKETVGERGIRLLTEEYERQRVLLTANYDEVVATLEADIARYHFEDWALAEVYERVLENLKRERGIS